MSVNHSNQRPNVTAVLTFSYSLAAQDALRWILKMHSKLPPSYSDADIKDFIWSTLKDGRVVPGYGHAILRKPDPRFKALMDFASARPEILEDPLYQLVERNSKVAPEILLEHGKVRYQSPRANRRRRLLILPIC